ncbi:DUF2569 domain-containing protein [Altererythrobacter aurantiacus]|uniref:DUF2569 domain-containing protein n=1 Tax=Parapontixanthobacter aurantiacus TaxID=1463599 RepID=A0A844ZDZ2_9SPHN|nr:DUF2569 domain-containing protein [Parapontixanthobacter aurantiacus]MXO85998.1 DUF2569 domain-containing protein [Parapontixanthobacter aurantiacus]
MMASMERTVRNYIASLYGKSVVIVAFLKRRTRWIALAWLAVILPLAAFRIAFPILPYTGLDDMIGVAAGYSLVAIAPIAGFLIARNAFLRRETLVQPRFRLALFGKWKRVDRRTARKLDGFGPVGFMASLIVGMMMNVVFRSGEYFLAIPAMGHAAPEWGQVMFWVMTADLVVTSFFYMVCFAMALRTVPLFPRMLVFAWVMDIAMQLTIAQVVSGVADLPPNVAVALGNVLEGNVTKVLISAAIWLPYLLLSDRVNLTYRHRVAA